MYTGKYECLEIFARPDGPDQGSIVLTDCEGRILKKKELEHEYGTWVRLPVEKDSIYQVKTEHAWAALAYLSGREDILEEGVCVLDPCNDFKELEGEAYRRFCDTPYREQYHFTPIVNWLNDPNGLCWYQGYYHLFYQYNPFGQEWNNMYWGHAASKDLVHWKHLPIVLEPQKEILNDQELKGGAFSGSALPQEDKVLFFLTRHIGPQEDGSDTVQYQTMMDSRDMVNFSPEKEIIREKPKGANFDFRDPKAGEFGDRCYLVLGSCMEGKGSILLYESEDKEHWHYRCPLITESQPIRTIECPDFFKLDGTYVAMGAWMDYYDQQGRFQPSRYYIGKWNGRRLHTENEQWVDFGSNCYAAQTFSHNGRRIFMGWVSDFYKEHVVTEPGTYGSMTIPRELHVRQGRIYALPVKEIYSLRREKLFSGEIRELKKEHIPGNQYYARITFENQGDFQIIMGKDGEKEIRLVAESGKVFLKTQGVKSSTIEFLSSVKECRSAEIFVDRRTVEVYLNDGEDVGTKLFYNSRSEGYFFLKSKELSQTELFTMDSVW
ncbi:MAG: glycoside hydrolase family 32 protein [Eubacteriales bacterium]|nr:glycoside hydrolase family 32 protein [Eubacteriales bacterium]